MEFGLGVLLALIAVAVTVTPGISNGTTAAIAWLVTILYAGWLFNRHRDEVLSFIRDNQGWTTFCVVLLAAVVAGGIWWNFVLPLTKVAPQADAAPTVIDEPLPTPTVTASVLSRIYTDGVLDPTAIRSTHDFAYQELFADWSIRYTADRDTPKLAITITRLQLQDRVAPAPPSASVSRLMPKWMSGFDEPGKEPDWYSVTVTFADLVKGEQALIAIRRSLGDQPNVPPSTFIRIEDIRSPLGPMRAPMVDINAEAARLTSGAIKLATFKHGKRQLPLLVGTPPKAIKPGEFQITAEARCDTDDCERMTMRNIEVRKR